MLPTKEMNASIVDCWAMLLNYLEFEDLKMNTAQTNIGLWFGIIKTVQLCFYISFFFLFTFILYYCKLMSCFISGNGGENY